MATNKPPGDDARKGAVRKRSQLKTRIEGENHWTKRSRGSGQFMTQKKDPNAGPYKGIRKERYDRRSACPQPLPKRLTNAVHCKESPA